MGIYVPQLETDSDNCGVDQWLNTQSYGNNTTEEAVLY